MSASGGDVSALNRIRPFLIGVAKETFLLNVT